MRSLKLSFLLVLFACAASAAVPIYDVDVVHTYPHECVGLHRRIVLFERLLVREHGLEEHSTIRKVRIDTGAVVQKNRRAPAILRRRDRQLAPPPDQPHVEVARGFVYDLAGLKVQREFHYEGEGWALTQDGKQLIMSDGTPELRFLNPETLRETNRIQVTLDGKPVRNVNELEWVKGEIYANVWETIGSCGSTERRPCLGVINLAGLLTRRTRSPAPTRCSTASRTTSRATAVRHGQELAEAV